LPPLCGVLPLRPGAVLPPPPCGAPPARLCDELPLRPAGALPLRPVVAPLPRPCDELPLAPDAGLPPPLCVWLLPPADAVRGCARLRGAPTPPSSTALRAAGAPALRWTRPGGAVRRRADRGCGAAPIDRACTDPRAGRGARPPPRRAAGGAARS